MAVGIVVVCLFLGGVRWFISYAPEKKSPSHASAQSANEAGAGSPSVRAFVCKKSTFVDNLVLTGTLQGGARVELRFNREGKISRIAKRVGETVKRGDTIAELDTGEANIRLQQAESELSQTVELYRAGAVAKPRLTQAQLAAQLAREEFSRSYIRAPREGSIGELNAEVGEYVNTQMTVASLVSVDTVFAEMGVIEKDLSKLTLGQTVKVEVESYPGTVFEGKITNISPIVEGTSRTRSVKAEIPNPKGVLLPGMFARTKIFVMEKPDTLVVPATAVRLVEKVPTVYLIAASKAKATPVKTGYESVDYIEILNGISEGDHVIAQITDQIRDGAHVEVVEETSYGSQ